MKNKIICLLLAMIMCVACLAGCNGGGDDSGDNNSTNNGGNTDTGNNGGNGGNTDGGNTDGGNGGTEDEENCKKGYNRNQCTTLLLHSSPSLVILIKSKSSEDMPFSYPVKIGSFIGITALAFIFIVLSAGKN